MRRTRLVSIFVLAAYIIFTLPSASAAAEPAAPSRPAAGDGWGPSMRTAHRWLGYGAAALGVVAAISSSSEDLHCASAWGAVVLGSAALTTGIVKYRRAIDLGDGISRRDGHAILGGLAAAGLIAAVVMAGSGGEEEEDDIDLAHAGIGGAAVAAMAVSVIVIKVKW